MPVDAKPTGRTRETVYALTRRQRPLSQGQFQGLNERLQVSQELRQSLVLRVDSGAGRHRAHALHARRGNLGPEYVVHSSLKTHLVRQNYLNMKTKDWCRNRRPIRWDLLHVHDMVLLIRDLIRDALIIICELQFLISSLK